MTPFLLNISFSLGFDKLQYISVEGEILMYTYIDKAIRSQSKLFIKMDDESIWSGLPSWAVDRSRVKIESDSITVWIPLNEVMHVTVY